ncbi:MAG: GGDEF domain-containing protein [Oscillospiraceae bacterium]|jgi:diguanylate cyclase (GGDEF)-like protein|nr:GGDEF domain-containing protein [Oscillospiraceae bacterium]
MGNKKRILFVDGENDEILALADAVKGRYAAVTSDGGKIVIEETERLNPDLVVMTGQEFLRIIELVDMTDSLTKLPNRRQFEMQASREWERAIREKKVISIMLIDIDKFGRFNELNHEPKGNDLLRAMADILRTSIKRPSDGFARFEGDQFIAILPGTYSEGAKELAEQIRAQVEELAVPVGNGKNVTVSIGINTAAPKVGSSFELFQSGVKKTLASCKGVGGDCIRIMV